MKERPILFSGAMVRALLAGAKTQTRRVVKPQPPADKQRVAWYEPGVMGWAPPEVPSQHWHKVRCPYGQPGDRLWVRESGAMHALLAPEDPAQPWLFRHDVPATAGLGHYWVQRTRAPGASYSTECTREQFLRHSSAKVVPSIHMPRWASRITLEITSVRVERLQDISEADAVAEGIEQMPCAVPDTRLWRNYDPGNGWTPSLAIPQNSFRSLWESINGPDSWDENPWVWVVEFPPPTTA